MDDHPTLSQSSCVSMPLKNASEEDIFLTSWNCGAESGCDRLISLTRNPLTLFLEHGLRVAGSRNSGPSRVSPVLARYARRVCMGHRG